MSHYINTQLIRSKSIVLQLIYRKIETYFQLILYKMGDREENIYYCLDHPHVDGDSMGRLKKDYNFLVKGLILDKPL